MTLSEVQLTIPSLIKALSIHLEHEAIRPVVGQLVPKERIIRSRMVIVNKKQPQLGFEPKGRLCVGGHKDPDLGKYEAASPTALSLAHSLLICIATTLGWQINIADVTAAFLKCWHSQEQILCIRTPSRCPQEVLDYMGWRFATKGILGLSESLVSSVPGNVGQPGAQRIQAYSMFVYEAQMTKVC